MDSEKKAMLSFLAKFFIIYGVLQGLILFLDLSFIQTALAGLSAAMVSAQANGVFVRINSGAFEVTASCTGLVSASILAAIIFSLKKPEMKKKFLFFIAGAVALFLVNIARLYLVLSIGKAFGINAAETAHVLSWFAMSAAIIALWYYGTKKLIGIKEFGELI
ncbi:MAG: exosortase/archaeosortase family protein [Candidatus Diapherotrites archaeon]